MYKTIDERIRKALRHHIHERYKTDVPVVTERPPKLAMGEVASPVCFELAKRLKKPPRALAQEIANSLKPIPGVARVEVAGGGYLNAFFDRAAFFRAACEEAGKGKRRAPRTDAPKMIVEHTSINPNKAAHIGHLRNAVLGDTFVRLLRYAGQRVEVQNYIDNTGVQVADVVLGFLHLEPQIARGEVRALAAAPKFDYYCWDLYTRVTLWLAEDKSRLEIRAQTLKEIEEGPRRGGEDGGNRVDGDRPLPFAHARPAGHRLRFALARERNPAPEILGRGVRHAEAARGDPVRHVRQECRLLGDAAAVGQRSDGRKARREEAEEEPDELADAKIIVRSNGTVTYVGKDIAYHLWKFGLLGRDFHYAAFTSIPTGTKRGRRPAKMAKRARRNLATHTKSTT